MALRLSPALAEFCPSAQGGAEWLRASWMIARLGGWKGYASERKPGPITMHYGLIRFALIAAVWRATMAIKNVCMP